MRTKLKRLKRTKPDLPPLTQGAQKSWAERHAPFATIVGSYSTLLAVIIAGLGYYFTVIPLYQKAALDELIAKREVELKVAQAAITAAQREAYEQRRDNFLRAIALSVDDCADVRSSFTQSAADPLDETAKRADHQRRIALTVEVSSCLASTLKKHNAEELLTPIDFRYITTLFENVGVQLDRKRIEAKAAIADLPNAAKRDSSVLEPVGPLVQQNDEFQLKTRKQLSEMGIEIPGLNNATEQRIQYRIGITQEKIASEYRLNAFQTILDAVRGASWPAAGDSPPKG